MRVTSCVCVRLFVKHIGLSEQSTKRLASICHALCHWRASPIASLVFEGGVRLVRNCDEATGACACGHAQFGGRQPHLKRALYVLRLAGARSARPRSRRILGIRLVGALVLAYALACGQPVLVHSVHSIHRSGSFVVLFLALMLRLAYARENTNWDDLVARAWTFGSTDGMLRAATSATRT